MKARRLVISWIIASLLGLAGCATSPEDELRRQEMEADVDVLRGRCPNLDDDSIFIMTPSMGGRLCDADQFKLVDRLDSLSRASTAPTCLLGVFRPVTEAQVKEVEHRLEVR